MYGRVIVNVPLAQHRGIIDTEHDDRIEFAVFPAVKGAQVDLA